MRALAVLGRRLGRRQDCSRPRRCAAGSGCRSWSARAGASRDDRRRGGPLRRQPGAPGRGRPAADRRGHLRRRHHPPGHAARLLRPQPAPAGADRRASTRRPRCALPGRARRLHRGRPQRRRPRGLVHRHREPGAGHARGRRWPRARPGSRATRSPWWSRTAATSPRTRPSWSTSTTSRCPRWPTTRPPATSEALVHEGYPGNLAGQLGGAPWPRRSPTVYDARGARGHRDDLAAGLRRRPDGDPRPGRGVVARQRRADRSGPPPRRRTRCGCSRRGCSACPSTRSG